MKLQALKLFLLLCSRSRKGAWIEIVANKLAADSYNVAPVRERGLKYDRKGELMNPPFVAPVRERGLKSLSDAGETLAVWVAPVRERGLKWKISALTAGYNLVAPVRERGLKCQDTSTQSPHDKSLP